VCSEKRVAIRDKHSHSIVGYHTRRTHILIDLYANEPPRTVGSAKEDTTIFETSEGLDTKENSPDQGGEVSKEKDAEKKQEGK